MFDWIHRRHTPLIIGVLCFLGMILLHGWIVSILRDSHRDEVTTELNLRLANVRAQLEQRLNATLFLTQGFSALIALNERLESDQFFRIAQAVMDEEPMIRNIGLAPNNVIRYVYPQEGNKSAIGLNYLAQPDQREPVLEAIRNRQTTVAGPLQLVQGGQGIISRKPVFLPGDGDPRYWGIISIVVDADKLFAELQSQQLDEIQLAIRGRDGQGAQGEVFFGEPAVFDRSPITMEVSLPHGSWQLAALPRNGWAEAWQIAAPIHYGGYLMALAIGLLVYLTLRNHREVALLARHDPLTGLPNRRWFSELLRQSYGESLRYHRSGALLLLDLDKFKPVNDTYGHQLGDLVLKAVACRLTDVVRRSDTVSRIGGDEFLVLLPQIEDRLAPKVVAEKLINAVCQPLDVEGVQVTLGVSIGISYFPLPGVGEAQLIARADRAMYQAKQRGGNGYAICA